MLAFVDIGDMDTLETLVRGIYVRGRECLKSTWFDISVCSLYHHLIQRTIFQACTLYWVLHGVVSAHGLPEISSTTAFSDSRLSSRSSSHIPLSLCLHCIYSLIILKLLLAHWLYIVLIELHKYTTVIILLVKEAGVIGGMVFDMLVHKG